MVLPVGFFMPLPLAMMIPFMGVQSAVMAKQFGENFQYGKRRISAMSNEEFNKLTPLILMQRANEELKSIIPSMEQSITEMRGFQEFIIKEFIEMINQLISRGLGSLVGSDVTEAIEHFVHGHGYPAHTGEEPVAPVPPSSPPPVPPGPGGPGGHVHIPGEHGHPSIPLPPAPQPPSHIHTEFHAHAGERRAPTYYMGNQSQQDKNWTTSPTGGIWYSKQEWNDRITYLHTVTGSAGSAGFYLVWRKINEAIRWGLEQSWYFQ